MRDPNTPAVPFPFPAGPDVRITRLPPMRMLLSPPGNPEAEAGPIQAFHDWVIREFNGGNPEIYHYAGGLPLYSYNDDQGLRFLVRIPDEYQGSHPWTEVQFPGGWYAVFSAWLHEIFEKYGQTEAWLKQNPLFEADENASRDGRYGMSNIVTPPELQEMVKSEQHNVFVPIKLRSKQEED